MRRVWLIIYLVLLSGAAFLGYVTATPGRSRPVHSTIASGCVFTFALACISTVVVFSRAHAKGALLRWPSLYRRFPWVLWEDPLQVCFGWTLLALGSMLGSAHAYGSTDQNAVWMLVWFSCLFSGLVIGQVIGYVIYREHIQKA